MPRAARRPCTYPGCGALTDAGRCEKHRRAAQREQDARRGSSSSRGYGHAWREAREMFLRAHPLCECPDCGAGAIRTMPATVVDHKDPHRGDMALFWDQSNWQAMAKACHDRKTAREDGGFSNATKGATHAGRS